MQIESKYIKMDHQQRKQYSEKHLLQAGYTKKLGGDTLHN